MNWYKKTFPVEERNGMKFNNAMREIQSQLDRHPEKRKYFAVLKDLSDNKEFTVFFPPTDDPNFMTIVYNDLNSEPCEKPNIKEIALLLGTEEFIFNL